MNYRTKIWTNEEIDLLRKFANERTPVYKMMDYFHLGYKTIINKLQEIGIEKDKVMPWTKEHYNLLYKYLNNEITYDFLIKSIDKKEATIKRKIFKLRSKIKFREIVKSYWNKELDDQLKLLLLKGYHYTDISEIMKLSRQDIMDRAYQLKLLAKQHRETDTKENIEKIKNFHFSGLTDAEISINLDLPIKVITYIRTKYKICRIQFNLNENKDDIIFKMADENKTMLQIKIATNCSKKFIAERLRILYPIENRPERIKKMIDRGYSLGVLPMIRSKLKNARKACKKIGREFNINEDDILILLEKQKWLCYYTNIKMSAEKRDKFQFSIDRVDSSRGYTIDNIVLCIKDINRTKLDSDLKDLFLYSEKLLQNKEKFIKDGFLK